MDDQMPWEMDWSQAQPVPNDTPPWDMEWGVSDDNSWAITRGFKSGVKGIGESTGSALEGIGQTVDSKLLEETGTKLKRYSEEASKSGVQRNVPTFGDLTKDFDLSKLGTFIGESLGQGAASSLPSLVTGVGAGAVVPGPPQVKAAAALGGLAFPSAIQNFGDIRGQLIQEGVDKESANRIGGLATIPVTALDTFSGGKLFSAFGKDKLIKAGVDGLIKRIGREGLAGASREGITEALQQGIQEYVAAATTGNSDASRRWSAILDAGLQGAITGGVMQAPAGFREGRTEIGEDYIPPSDEGSSGPPPQLAPPKMMATPEGRVGSEANMESLGLSPDIWNAIRAAKERDAELEMPKAEEFLQPEEQTSKQPLALPPPKLTDAYIGGPEGIRRATTADIQSLPEEGQITPSLYRFSKQNTPVETSPEQGGSYKITLPNGETSNGTVTGFKNNRAYISLEDGRQVRPLVSATKFMTIPREIETKRGIEFRPPDDRGPPAADVIGLMPKDILREGLEKPRNPSIEEIDREALKTELSPTDAQKEAGNYPKGQFKWNGLDISIENPRGSKRSGIDRNWQPWSVEMPDHYGYIKKTEGKDGDHVDIYMGKNPESDRVFVVDQINAENGRFDEHKIMAGYKDKASALDAYRLAFSDNKAEARVGNVTEMSIPRLKEWLKNEDTTIPVSNKLDFKFRSNEPLDRARIVPLKTLNPDQAHIQTQLADFLNKVAGEGVGARLVKSIQDQNNVHDFGAFSPANKLAYIALNDASGIRDLKSLFKTTRHEAIHALKDSGALPERDWKLLENKAQKDWIKKYGIDKDYGHLPEELQREEAIAEAFADRKSLKDGPVVKSIMDKISNFFERVKNFFSGGKYASVDDIFQDMENGKYSPAQAESEFVSRSIGNAMAEQGKTPEQTLDIGIVLLQRPSAREQAMFKAKDLDDMNWFTKAVSMPRNVAYLYKQAAPYFANVEKMYETISKYQHQLHDVMKPYFDLPEAKKQQLNKWFEYARLAGVEKYTGPVKNKFTTNRPYYDKEGNLVTPPTLTKVGEVITLPADLAKAANSVHDGMATAMRMLRGTIMQKYGFDASETPSSLIQKLSLAERELSNPNITLERRKALRSQIGDLNKAVDAAEKFSLQMAGYTPNARQGKYGFSVMDKEGRRVGFYTVNDKLHEKIYARVTGNPTEGQRLMMKLRKMFPASEGFKIGTPLERSFKHDEVEPGLYSLLDTIIGRSEVDEVAEQKINEARDKIMAEKGFKSHFLKSDNMAGYDTDYQFSIPQYVMGLSHFLGKQEMMGKLEDSLGEMKRLPKLYQWGKDHLKYIMSAQEEAQVLRFLASQYYLATNPSSMIVNSSQPWMVSLPYMSMFGRGAAFANELTRSYNDFRKMVTSGGIDISRAPADIKSELLELHKDGNLLPLQLSEYNANAVRDGAAISPAVARIAGFFGMPVKNAMKLLNNIYSGAEQMNRIVTAISAIRTYKSDPKLSARIKDVLKHDDLAAQSGAWNSATDFAKWLNAETNFRYGKMNRSEIMRGTIGATGTQFRSYLFNSLELLYRMWGQGKEGKMAVLGVYLPIMVSVAGVMGIPAADFLVGISQYLYNQFADEKKDFRQEIMEAIQNLAPWTKGKVNDFPISYLIMNGVPPAALGTNLSQRVGLNIGIDPNAKPPEDSLQWFASLTPSTDLIINAPIRALNLARQDRYTAAVAQALPSILRNPLTAYDWSSGGIRTQSGRNIMNPEDITSGELAMKAIGFQPSRISKVYQEQAAKTFSKDADKEFRGRIYSNLAMALSSIRKATSESDRITAQARYDSLIEQVREYNKTATRPIRSEDLRNSIRSRMAEEELGVKGRKVPRSLQKRFDEIEESYGEE